MGGPACSPSALEDAYAATSAPLKAATGCPLIPIGSLAVGAVRHRALLFKLLCDGLNIRARLQRRPQGQQAHGGAGSGAGEVVEVVVAVNGGEWLVDLLACPGALAAAPAANGGAAAGVHPPAQQHYQQHGERARPGAGAWQLLHAGVCSAV